MLKKLTFGQYAHKNTVIHKLDPRIKILSVVILSAFVFFIRDYQKMLIFSILILSLAVISKISFNSLIRNLRPFSSIILFILLMYILFSRNDLHKGTLSIWGFLLFITIALILTFTTTITSMVTAIEKLLAPLKFLKINPRTIALLISLTIRFIPSLFLYADRIKDARLARLGSLRKPKHIKLLFLPLLDRLFKSASTLSDAMAARSYTEKRISYFNIIILRYYDYASFILLIIFIIFILLL
ncbi:MAG: energy-coupling factor transporter transmembrane component T [Nanoarchaeota archaeon]